MTGIDLELDGKVVMVTGAGSREPGIGNGRACAVLLARGGATVALVDAVARWAADTERLIADEGGTSAVFEADVGDPGSCQAVVDAVLTRFGSIYGLVNNVGIAGPPGDALDVDPDAWDATMRVNVKSMMLMSKFAIPAMVAGGSGSIVHMASAAGMHGGHPALAYATAKGAVVNLTRSMATHHGLQGVRVNAVAPGMVYTPMVVSRGMSDELREQRRKRSLLQTEGTGWDVAGAVVFLMSGLARWITGVTMPVDAGYTAGTPLPTPART